MSNLKERWIEALESGKYTQGRGQLRLQDSFCCLGVLCDLVNPNGWVQQQGGGWEDEDWDESDYIEWNKNETDMPYWQDSNEALAPDDVPYMSSSISKGLEPTDNDKSLSDVFYELVDMNDQQEKNFKEIADYIREEIL